jgi:hypothetical protein
LRAPIPTNGSATALHSPTPLIQRNKIDRLPVEYLSLPLATSAQK